LQGESELRGWLASLQLDEEADTHTGCGRKLLLSKTLRPSDFADELAESCWCHIPDREDCSTTSLANAEYY
jgi:hypothetical protein